MIYEISIWDVFTCEKEQGRAGEELITGDQKSGHPN